MKPVMTLTMDVRLLRIDSRLLHGQVATSWAKTTKVDRILVVSDDVAKDNLRKTLIMQAAPPGVKANVLTISKMLRIYYDSRFDFINAMILVENPVDAIRLISGGIKVSSVNIGYSSGCIAAESRLIIARFQAMPRRIFGNVFVKRNLFMIRAKS